MSNPVRIKVKGEVKTLNEWCEIYNISRSTVYARVRLGRMSFEEAIKKPVQSRDKVEKTGRNNKKQLCRKCQYRGSIGSNIPADLICEYMKWTGHMRPCKAVDCTVYIKGNPKKNSNAIMMADRSRYE